MIFPEFGPRRHVLVKNALHDLLILEQITPVDQQVLQFLLILGRIRQVSLLLPGQAMRLHKAQHESGDGCGEGRRAGGALDKDVWLSVRPWDPKVLADDLEVGLVRLWVGAEARGLAVVVVRVDAHYASGRCWEGDFTEVGLSVVACGGKDGGSLPRGFDPVADVLGSGVDGEGD